MGSNLKHSKLIVVKLSSLAVTNGHGQVSRKKINRIVQDICRLKDDFKQKIIVVSSGAINLGKTKFKTLDKKEIVQLQAASAVGQPILMHELQKAFNKYNLTLAQVLLTHEDLKNKQRSFNVKKCLEHLLEEDKIPIVNENDAVSFEEITLGDNDQLSALIAVVMEANILYMLTQADGLFKNQTDQKPIAIIEYDDDFKDINFYRRSSAGKGGMQTKLQAVRKVTPLGIEVFISSFEKKDPLLRGLLDGQGSFFKAKRNPSKKSWIIPRVKNSAVIKVDEGAAKALLKHSSLLPVGIVATSGSFKRGDAVQIKFKNKVLAFGISEYSQSEIERIKGLKSSELNLELNFVSSKVVIHKNNLILKEDPS